MARIENHKYSIEEAFRECFYIVPDYRKGSHGPYAHPQVATK
jgi:hypothetical protein